VTPLQQAEAKTAAAQTTVERIEQDATTVNRLVWGAVVLASLPPLVGVTQFAMHKGVPGAVAWVIDPSFIFVIAASIAAHESLSRHGEEKIGFWLHLVPWLAAGASLYLNTAEPLHLDGNAPPDWGGVGAHGLPSLVTLAIIEGASSYRARMRRRLAAAREAVTAAEETLRHLQIDARQEAAARAELERQERTAHDERQRAEREAREHEQREREDQERRQAAAARERAADRAHALELARLAAATGHPIGQPGGQQGGAPHGDAGGGRRRLTQDELDAIAREIAAEIQDTPGWEPDYERLQATYGRGRRWCEDRVSAARLLTVTAPRLHAVGADA
jgi:DNA repair exonuclease SbcCD ATPase subunit